MPKSSKMQNHLIHISIQFQYIPQPFSKLSLADPLGTYGAGHTLSFLILDIQQSDQLGRLRSGSGTARIQLLLMCLGCKQTVHTLDKMGHGLVGQLVCKFSASGKK